MCKLGKRELFGVGFGVMEMEKLRKGVENFWLAVAQFGQDGLVLLDSGEHFVGELGVVGLAHFPLLFK